MAEPSGYNRDDAENERSSDFETEKNTMNEQMKSPTSKSVLIIGFDPQYLDFSSPELAPLNLSAEKIMAGFAAETERLRDLGYESDGCLVDLGETAEASLASRLRAKKYDCVIIGAGVRANPKYFLLFERLLNVVHEFAPKARIGFNTKPTDTVEAVQRCLRS